MTLCYYLQNLISAFVNEHKQKTCQYNVSVCLSLFRHLCVRLLGFIIKNSVPKPIRRLTIFGNDQWPPVKEINISQRTKAVESSQTSLCMGSYIRIFTLSVKTDVVTYPQLSNYNFWESKCWVTERHKLITHTKQQVVSWKDSVILALGKGVLRESGILRQFLLNEEEKLA